MPDTPINFENVRAESEDSFGMLCAIGARHVYVGTLVPLAGTLIRAPGDRGRLVLPLWFVELHELRAEEAVGSIVTDVHRAKVHEQTLQALMRATFAEVLHRAADEITSVPDERLAAIQAAVRALIAAMEKPAD